MTAKNLKPEDAKALQKTQEVEPNFEDMEFTASTEVRDLPQELKQASAGTAAPQNVVPINKPQVAAHPQQARPMAQAPAQPQAPLPSNVVELQNRMKMMEMQQQAQLKLVEQTVTELLIQIKQKSQSIDQDVMRIKKILDSLTVKK
ncbi:MAG: hypothetical protein ACOYL6_14800 [Bacteriovoracaceae bacterium]